MITLDNWAEKALKKLDSERSSVSGQKESAMAGAVLATLKDFCKQESEFAQAIVEGGKFSECMKAVAKGVGHSISDLEAYKRAVKFYFPGAKINVQMTIDLVGNAAKGSPQDDVSSAGLVLNLADYL